MSATLYRCFDAGGRLIYVGSTTRSVAERMTAHRGQSWWAWMVAHVDESEHPDAIAARAAERQAIATENPRFNLLGRWSLRHAWTPQDYRDYYDATRFGASHYTRASRNRLARLREECLTRYDVDLTAPTKETA